MSAYLELKNRFSEIAKIGYILDILYWDTQTMMPKSAIGRRSDQLAYLSTLSHSKITAADMESLFDKASNETLDPKDQANLREMKRTWIHENAVPEKLVEESSKLSSMCENKWVEAKHNSDFALIENDLQQLLDISIEIGELKSKVLDCTPYETYLDLFDPGLRVDFIENQFADLKAFLPDFLSEKLAAQNGSGELKFEGPYCFDTQKQVGLKMIEKVGFDFSKGRVDVSEHPFCGGSPFDVRMTSAYKKNNFIFGLSAMLHESGHAMYEMGLSSEWLDQPAGRARGTSFHESQALFVELQLFNHPNFIEHFYPLFIEHFGLDKSEWPLEKLKEYYYTVNPGYIRIMADEVSYPLHVILRYEIEKDLFDKKIKISDIPSVWGEKMQQYFGYKPENDAQGCLQDIHWFGGAWGYFPNYTLGAMRAAQFFNAMKQSVEHAEESILKGQFSNIMGWLKENIHDQASFLDGKDLMVSASGEDLNSKYFIEHLQSRYK